ncbi:MAG: hypothetical protein N2380_09800 [bacterium]|nr:hypothetical protein [bacterium]
MIKKIGLISILVIVLTGLITGYAFSQNSWELGISWSASENRLLFDARIDYETMKLYLGNLQEDGDRLIVKYNTRGLLFSLSDESMNAYSIIWASTPDKNDVISLEVKLALEGYNDTIGLYKLGNSWGLGYKREGTEILGPILGSYDYRSYLTLNASGNFGFGTYSSLGFATGTQAISFDIGYIYTTSDIFNLPSNSLPFGIGYRERLDNGIIIGGKIIPYVCFTDGSWGANLEGSFKFGRVNFNLGLDYYKDNLVYLGKLILNLSDISQIILRANPDTVGISYSESF